MINVIVIAITATAEFGNSENAAELSEVKINWWLLIPATLCFLMAITVEIYKYIMVMRVMSRGKTDLPRRHLRQVARRTVLLGKYYDCVTPAAVGGQPFQIYYMHKNSKLPSGTATAVPIIGMISSQIGFLIVAILCFLFGSLTISNATLIATACFGLLFYAFWPVMIMIATFLPNATKEIINVLVKFLAKIRIVKNKEKAIKRIEFEVDAYARSVRRVLKTRGLFVKTIILSIGFNALIATIPFFVLTAFGGEVGFLPCFVTTMAVMSAVCFVPTPGNAGAAEGTFFVVFSALSQGYVFWAMLVWRFFSYYIYIIIGGVTYWRMHLEKKQGAKNGNHQEKTPAT
ncbi:MAG: lysylphosphatidylglycerol synthase transmembrane domain-containing protein [Candidatus Saccharibacteria bacterium]|nr:lysylphosphatidylglycerol synthase transmembrane domain-containing protein [Candidatus Saccharibacteria bacterium]